jgi:tetratricopeptide (TPR) repeat protein
VRGEDIQKAINQLKPVLSENPKLKNAYGLGILYMDNGEYDNAIATYKQGVENFPENALLWCNMAVALLMREDYAGAKDACRKALDIQPDGVIPNLCMTNILMINGEYKNAKLNIQDMKKLRIVQKGKYLGLIASCSRNEELARKVGRHLSRAIAYVNNKWYKRASVEYGEITKLMPSNTLAYHSQADILNLIREYDRAIEVCKKIIELEPESSTAYGKLAAIHNRKGEKDEAIVQYRKAISIDPENAAAYLNLGMLLEAKDVLNESIDAYKKVIELNPSSPVAYNNLAWLYATKIQDKLEDALKLAEKAKELAPNSAAIIDTLGMIYYRNGMNDEALPELETAVKGAPWNPTIRYHLGMVYYKKGQQSSALSQMERALKISNTFPEAEEARDLIKKITMIKEDAKKPVTVIQ